LSPDNQWSLGGDAVLQSLLGSGLPAGAGTYLRETRLPALRRPAVVLAQNALTVAPRSELRPILRAASPAIRVKIAAMTVIATVNFRRAGRIVVLSETMADYVERAVPRAAARVVVRPVTLPLDVVGHIHEDGTRRDPVAVVIASISAHKDLDTTVRALAKAADSIPLDEITIFGALDDPAIGRRISALARHFGIALRMTVVGRAELLRAASRAAVVVVPSVLESLGLALPEACVATPSVAAAAIPAHRELAARLGADVEWFEPGDVDSALAAILTAARRQTGATPVPPTVVSEWRAVVDALGQPARG
jgi:glycosyltransferase involved in cell wall biosynthesis